ncbi:SDR family oxidoreductase [Streptomyces sp. NPDC051098]|uniref:SDR family oxidoreductase n=1 Tax=Streptomyces sp. NPDC051098 TaxID=3155411 RepID=UPI0034265003
MSRSVLVADGDLGVGRTVADAFAAQGDWVAVTYPDVEPAPSPLLSVRCPDLSDPGHVETAFRTVEDAHGPVEVLVAPAEIGLQGRAGTPTCPRHLASVPLLQRAVDEMLWGSSGRIILIMAAHCRRDDARDGPCRIATRLVRTLARELDRRISTVNVITPAGIDPPMAGYPDRPHRRENAWDAPIAAAAVFLAMPESGRINGATLPVDCIQAVA